MKYLLPSFFLFFLSFWCFISPTWGMSGTNTNILEDSTVVFSIDTVNAENGELICLQLSTNHFEDIILMEMSITYDEQVLRYLNAAVLTDLLPGFNEATYSTPETNGSGNKFIISWLDNDLSGENILQETEIFDMCFEVIGNPGDKSPLNIENVEIANSSNEVIDADSRNGLVCVENGVSNLEINAEPTIKAFPNPSSGMISLNQAVEELSVWDISGRRVYQFDGASRREFDFQDLQPGSYWIQVNSQLVQIVLE